MFQMAHLRGKTGMKNGDAVRFSDFVKKEKVNEPIQDENLSTSTIHQRDLPRLSDLEGYQKSKKRLAIPARKDQETDRGKSLQEKWGITKENQNSLRNGIDIFGRRLKMASDNVAFNNPTQTTRVDADESVETNGRVRVSKVMVKDHKTVSMTHKRLFKEVTRDESKKLEGIRLSPFADLSVADNIDKDEQSKLSYSAGWEKKCRLSSDSALNVEATVTDADLLYQEIMKYVKLIKIKITAQQSFSLEPAFSFIGKLVKMPGVVEQLYLRTFDLDGDDDYRVANQVNVMIYALKLGFGMKYSKDRLIELALSSLMFNVGMYKVPDQIVNKRQKLSLSDVELIKMHPQFGKDILSLFGGRYPCLLSVAFEHHERENGQGYPRGLQGGDIREFAGIIGLLDSYEAMTHNRPYRTALEPSFSARELIRSKPPLYSTQAVRYFLREISLYPVGSYVKLNNNAIAQVVEINNNHPLRPRVRIVYDGQGNAVTEDVIVRLDQQSLFFIMGAVSLRNAISR